MQHRRYESLAFWARGRQDGRRFTEALAEAEALLLAPFDTPEYSDETGGQERGSNHDGDLDAAA
jgi:hypothetical protein